MSSVRTEKLRVFKQKNNLEKSDLIATESATDVEYRLARQVVVDFWKNGKIDTETVCDAQPMLKRNATHCGVPTGEECPICEINEIYYVTYVFGPRLPAHGRCISSKGELRRLNARKAQLSAYVIEVCSVCGWNHLVRSSSLGGN
ncbi:MAG: hypothetical protein CL517_00720 [Actinobacteria bacterium]|mgnify:FL=1|nr:hypothetical protein [Actinomycetota bacterium]MEC7809677.1 DUF5318 family protein [Actinomycetota bacterium]|tara:strand:+ start:25296 stop:25730 length:435 start_codon:yes stop_codon:yes gene_type:complete